MIKNRVAAYLRCSTTHQDVELQRRDLLEMAERRGWTVYRVFSDEGQSGVKDRRPALDELMKEARQGRFDLLAVWRLDRLGRSVAHLVNLLNELQVLGVSFVSHNEALDTTTPAGRVMFTILAALAAFERDILLERVRAGVARAKAEGVRFGRPRKGFDYRKAIELRAEGRSLREIASMLGVSRSTIHRLLR